MKKILNHLLIVLVCCGLSTQTFAQNKKAPNFQEGTITYEIQVEGVPEVSQFINGTELTVLFKDQLSKMDIGIMGGLAKFQFISNVQDKLYTVLMDVPTFYEKTAVPIDLEHQMFKDLKEKQPNQAPIKKAEKPEIQYNKKKRKKIAKYRCYSAEMDMESGVGDRMVVYLTDKIRPAAQSEMQRQVGAMDGYPLGFEMLMGGAKITIMAKSVKKESLEKELFEVPANYSEKSLDEIKEELQEKFGLDGKDIGL
ncbi:MAG: hypothetical protein GY810_05360 [Aureispira sp.]|nr:hypothetical protein [Aureispira sp.]